MTATPTIQIQQSPAAMTMRGRNILSKEQRREGGLLVSIMPIGSKDKYYNLSVLVGHRRVDNIICHSHAFSDKLSNPHLATSYVLHLGHTGLSPRPRGGKTPPSSSAWGLPSWLPASLNTWLTASSAARCRRLQPYRAKSVHSTVLQS